MTRRDGAAPRLVADGGEPTVHHAVPRDDGMAGVYGSKLRAGFDMGTHVLTRGHEVVEALRAE